MKGGTNVSTVQKTTEHGSGRGRFVQRGDPGGGVLCVWD